MKLKNNKGFSLIEIIIGMFILSIIISPLMLAFITSMKTAATSQETGEATTMAQTLAEQIEARELEDIVIDPSILVSSTSDIRHYSYNETENKYNTASATTDGPFYMGMTHEAESQFAFDTMITLNKDISTELTDVNDLDLSVFTGTDGSYAQPVTQSDNPDDVSFAQAQLEATFYNDSKLVSKERHIILDVEERTPGNVQATIQYEYKYTYEYVTSPPEVVDPDLKTYSTIVFEGDIVNPPPVELFPTPVDIDTDGDSTQDKTPAVAVYYFPWYDAIVGDSLTIPQDATLEVAVIPSSTYGNKDVITVTNDDGIDFMLFLIKQEHPELAVAEDIFNTRLQTFENAYDPIINLKNAVGSSSANKWDATLFTNVGINLAGTEDVSLQPDVKFNVSSGDSPWSIQMAEEPDGNLVQKESSPRIYSVKIDVYESGTTGTNFDDLSNARLLYSLETMKLL